MKKLEDDFHRVVSMARMQGVEWFISSQSFWDVSNIASMNKTIEIYNDVQGKVL